MDYWMNGLLDEWILAKTASVKKSILTHPPIQNSTYPNFIGNQDGSL